jgi:hypothetical protein
MKSKLKLPKRTTCFCDLCVKWYPIIRRVRLKLNGKLGIDFDNLITNLYCEAEDGDVAQAKLDGSWPGWEWLPGEIKSVTMRRVISATKLL